ncbi:flagellar filament capping protein FliD [Pseudoalteromonas agarivorans]|uniref:flagellar filament capping protein FliD n=1 Tax=Pseudoalteromonas agarivorans TaxID=176102 RepID=UPI0021185A8F|nr:flagellar filament capping protein FliD [Pseudoalteromonas agarivorans]MCQ8884839.1 flagellar filament capping protein FliD [Pseudoalteromonas agarivorans]
MATITSAGVGSGIDLESIIEATISAERTVKESQLNEREINYTTQLSGVGTFKSALDSFNDVLAKLGDAETYNSRIVSFANSLEESEQAFEVEVGSSMQSGDFSVEILQLAKGSKVQSAALGSAEDTLGAGNLTFNAGDNEFTIAVESTDTLEDIRNKINKASENFGVSANIVNSDSGAVLTFSSAISGSGNTLSVTADDDSLSSIATNSPSGVAGLSVQQAAQDANALINGQSVSNSTNELKDKIQGTTLTLKSETAEPQEFSVSVDEDIVKETLTEFVDAYNSLKGTLDSLSNSSSGLLASDSTIRTMEQQLQRMFTNELGGTTDIQSLMEIGVSFNREGEMEISSIGIGSLQSGEELLNSTISDKYSALQSFFSDDDGLVQKVDGLVELYTGSDGSLIKREQSLNESLETIETDRDALDERLANLEASLRSQYAALDSVMAQYQTSSSYISSILTNTSNS